MVESVTNDTVTLSWMEPAATNGMIVQYQIEYRICGQPVSSVVNVISLTHPITGLTIHTEYCFRVRAFTSVGIGPWTTAVMARTCKSCIQY